MNITKFSEICEATTLNVASTDTKTSQRPLRKKTIDFLTKSKNYRSDVTKFLSENSCAYRDFEDEIFAILKDFFQAGKSFVTSNTDHASDEAIKAGIKWEFEHTKCEFIARRIAMDHLCESPNYYKYLKEMSVKYKLHM